MFCPGSGTKQAQPCVRREGEMNKRKLGSFALCAMLFALGSIVKAQQPMKIPRIGFLSGRRDSTPGPNTDALRQGLRDRAYIEGKNILIEYRYSVVEDDRVTS